MRFKLSGCALSRAGDYCDGGGSVKRGNRISKLDLINRISHGRRIENVVYRIPSVTSKPVGAEKKSGFLRLEAGNVLPGLGRVLRHKDAVLPDNHHLLFVATKERTLPDVDDRSLLLPTRAFILADKQAICAPHIMRAMKKDRNPGLRIDRRNLGPGDAGVRAAIDAFALA